ncbi:MAG: hypothetical protein AB7G12_17180 [Thermoanaerobaculia bacterium]
MRKMWIPVVGSLLIAALLAPAPASAANRPRDRQVGELVDRANDRLAEFIDDMSRRAITAKVTRDGVETDVSDFLKDFQASGKSLAQRYSGSSVANQTALDFLRHAKAADGFIGRHPDFSGNDSGWRELVPTMESLAAAYNIDWASGPASDWVATRATDKEVSSMLGGLAKAVKSSGSAVDKAAKGAGMDADARKALTSATKGLGTQAKQLKSAFSSGQAIDGGVDKLVADADGIGSRIAAAGLPESTWAPAEKAIGDLARAFGR